MSMSLRDQLLAAGLVTQKQVKDAERQEERQTRHQTRQKRPQQPGGKQAPPPGARPGQAAAAAVQHAKSARDLELNRRQQEKAKRRALHAEIKQLLEQHSVPRVEGDDLYHFVDAGKIRHVAVDGAIRRRLVSGELLIVRHHDRYHFVAPQAAARIRERDPAAVVIAADGGGAPDVPAADDPYRDFAVPDDLIW